MVIRIIPIAPVVSENFEIVSMTGTIKIGRFYMIVSITLKASSTGLSVISGVTILD